MSTEKRGKTLHPDYFDHILPFDAPIPKCEPELLHIGSVALQVMFAGWGPIADLFYGALVLLLKNPEAYKTITKEIRNSFSSYEDIVYGKQLTSLHYLHACIEETLRALPSNLTGLPRISPGAVVDGQYIPKGVSVISCSVSPGGEFTFLNKLSLTSESYRPTSNLASGLLRGTLTIFTNPSTSNPDAGSLFPIPYTTLYLPATT